MITREELINNPESWISTEKLNLDFFDDPQKEDVGVSYFLKKKNSDEVYYGNYNPELKSFECLKLRHLNKEIIKREDVALFISLPPVHYYLNAGYSNIKPD